MEWNVNNTLLFINLIRERPAIWDSLSEDHKNKNKRHNAVEEIAKILGITIKEVNTKWTSLRGQFNREKKKITGIRTGSGADAICVTKWFAYNEMQSLMSCNVPQNSISNLDNYEEETSNSFGPATPTSPPGAPTPPPPPLAFTPTAPPPPQATQSLSIGAFKGTCGPSKRKNTGLYSEAMQTLKAIREKKRTQNLEDDLTSFGLFIAAQVRNFHPRLQSKAKYEINKLIYELEIENHNFNSGSIIERSQHSSSSDYSMIYPETPPSAQRENIYIEGIDPSLINAQNQQLSQSDPIYETPPSAQRENIYIEGIDPSLINAQNQQLSQSDPIFETPPSAQRENIYIEGIDPSLINEQNQQLSQSDPIASVATKSAPIEHTSMVTKPNNHLPRIVILKNKILRPVSTHVNSAGYAASQSSEIQEAETKKAVEYLLKFKKQ